VDGRDVSKAPGHFPQRMSYRTKERASDDEDAGLTGLVSLTVIAVPGCTVGNILLTISLSECSGGMRGAAPLASANFARFMTQIIERTG
ncbi:MAG TPA: hypothetical protein VE687_02655, partial [Stellaceae bacterium]|nr:hypothetical protein [Stellaceae bacterium]